MNPRLLTFFMLQRLIGSRAGAWYRHVLAMERWPAGRFIAWRDARLRRLLDHAATAIPHYRDLGLSPGAPLEAFPVITKERLHDHYLRLMLPSFREEYQSGRKPRGYGWLEVTSGGTTGIPTTVIHDAEFRDMDRAARLYNQHLAGFPFGTPHYRLWGAMNDIQRVKKSFSQKLMARLARETLLNAFQMDDDRIASYLDILSREPRDHLIAYVDALEQLAVFAENRGIPLPSFRSIITTGGTLTADTENRLKQAFHARIHNQYGSRDCGALACSCDHGGLHILAPNVFIEVLDADLKPVPAGREGSVHVTFLGNSSFPIIRFEIGDVAEAGPPEPCACGRPFPLLGRVTARTVDLVRDTRGGFITPVFIRHTVGVVHGQRKIRRYQFIQAGRTQYELLLQPEAGIERGALDAMVPGLRRDLLEVLGPGAALDIRFEPLIAETAGGKFRHVINRYRPGP